MRKVSSAMKYPIRSVSKRLTSLRPNDLPSSPVFSTWKVFPLDDPRNHASRVVIDADGWRSSWLWAGTKTGRQGKCIPRTFLLRFKVRMRAFPSAQLYEDFQHQSFVDRACDGCELTVGCTSTGRSSGCPVQRGVSGGCDLSDRLSVG